MSTTCQVEECGQRTRARGMCPKHYRRFQRYGDPTFSIYVRGSDEERFTAYVDKNGPVPTYAPHLGPCWLWTRATNRAGYGIFTASRHKGNQTNLAHRFSVESSRGSIPEGHEVDHLCRVRQCVNPDHLEVVTPRENKARAAAATLSNEELLAELARRGL